MEIESLYQPLITALFTIGMAIIAISLKSRFKGYYTELGKLGAQRKKIRGVEDIKSVIPKKIEAFDEYSKMIVKECIAFINSVNEADLTGDLSSFRHLIVNKECFDRTSSFFLYASPETLSLAMELKVISGNKFTKDLNSYHQKGDKIGLIRTYLEYRLPIFIQMRKDLGYDDSHINEKDILKFLFGIDDYTEDVRVN